jgi:hypothetical protein
MSVNFPQPPLNPREAPTEFSFSTDNQAHIPGGFGSSGMISPNQLKSGENKNELGSLPTNTTLGGQLQQPFTLQAPQLSNFLSTGTTYPTYIPNNSSTAFVPNPTAHLNFVPPSPPPQNSNYAPSSPPPQNLNVPFGSQINRNNPYNFGAYIPPSSTTLMYTWLMKIGLGEYTGILQFHGYDLELIQSVGFTEQDLDAMGIVKRAHRKKLLVKYKIQQ